MALTDHIEESIKKLPRKLQGEIGPDRLLRLKERLSSWLLQLIDLKRIILVFLAITPFIFLSSACNQLHDASYSAHVFIDANFDGKKDSMEEPLEGVVIQIVDPRNGLLWGQYITDSEGNINAFSAGGVCGGYEIWLMVPEGYAPTTPVKAITPNCEVAQFGLRLIY